jgi:heptosyltransferase-2
MVREVDEVIEIGKGAAPLFRRDGPVSDAVLLLPNSFRSALVAARSGIPERWGYRTEGRGPLLTRAVDRAPAGLHQVEYYQQLVYALGFPNGPGEPHIQVSPKVRAVGARVLSEAGWDGAASVVALAPGAAYGGAKRWPPEYFAELARALAGDGVRPALVGSVADAATGREIETALGDPDLMLNLIGRTDVTELAGVLANARALVANDSGAMHLGAAVGVPLTAVFGPTDERVTSPRSPLIGPSYSR